MSPKQGTDAALGMAMGHVILREFHIDRQAKYFEDYARQYTDMPMLVRLVKQGAHYVPERFIRASDVVKGCGEANNPEWKTLAYDETSNAIVVPKGSVGFRWGEKGKWNLEEKASKRPRHQAAAVALHHQGRCRGGRLPLFRQSRARSFPRHRSSRRAHAQRAGEEAATGRGRDAGRLGVRSVRGELRRRSRLRRRTSRQELRRSRALHAGLGGKDHRRAARPDHHGGARVRAQRREDQGPVDGDRRRRSQSLVPHGHELPRHHQHAGDVRMRRPIGRRLVALCRPGKAAPANRLVAARLRPRLEPSAAADQFDLGVLRAYRPVALRDARRVRNSFADGAGRPVGRRADRLQRARRTHGLAAVSAAAAGQPARSRPSRRPPRVWKRRTMSPRL